MELIREIYRGIIKNSEFMGKAEQAVIKEIEELTVIQKGEMALVEYEKFRDILFSVSAIAQEESFIAGVEYGMTMLAQSFIHTDTKEF